MRPEEELEAARERGWREVAAIDAAYRAGEIDQAGWHDAVRALVEPAYLGASTVQGGSGHGGTPAEWDRTRRPVMTAIAADGDILDIGCANGLLMESLRRWAVEDGLRLEPYGVDISAAIVEVARARLPHWADRIWAANAATWEPPRRWDYVRTGLEYVPDDRAGDFVAHLLAAYVAPGGRLIIGKSNERRDRPGIGNRLRSWGHRVAGELRLPHEHPGLEMTWHWIDA